MRNSFVRYIDVAFHWNQSPNPAKNFFSIMVSHPYLEDQGFLKSEVRAIGLGRGRSTCFTMRVPTESTVKVLMEDTVFQTAREWEGKNTTLDGFGR